MADVRELLRKARYASRDEPENALGFIEEAIALNPGRAASWYEHARLLDAMDRAAEARQSYSRVVALNPTHRRANDALRRLSRHSGGAKS